jgi:tRNA(Ile)-lysidine synthase
MQQLAVCCRASTMENVSDLAGHIQKSIHQRKLLRKGQAVLIAVSGGVDSMVLLQVLHELSRKQSWKLIVAHLNHQLRGRASRTDESLVSDTARKLGLPFVVDRADVRLFAWKQKLSIEMAARKVRHDFLAREALRLGSHTVALAHHADDQLELFFVRLLRGSGGEGLAGMKWSGPSPSNKQVLLVRPLLDLTRKELKDFATKKAIRFCEDTSNHSFEFQRNRIRHELLPLLRRHYQKSLDKVILRVAEILGAEADFTTQCAQDWIARMHSERTLRYFRSTRGFEGLPVALQRRIIQIQSLELGFPADFEIIEKLRLNSECPTSISSRNSVPSYLLRDKSGQIRVSTLAKIGFQPNSQEVSLSNRSGDIVFDGLSVQWRKGPGSRPPRTILCGEYFDADKVGSSILLRHWKPGDRFKPIGSQYLIKLQDFFTNEKVPREKRLHLALGIAENGEIFWIEGLRISEHFKVSKATKRLLEWRWTK